MEEIIWLSLKIFYFNSLYVPQIIMMETGDMMKIFTFTHVYKSKVIISKCFEIAFKATQIYVLIYMISLNKIK